jgi:hypothetical protein
MFTHLCQVFPVRYYFIDFELSVRFEEDSKAEDRVVTGLPIRRLGLEKPEEYGRDIAPEMLSDKPHDPFKADIFQMGKLFNEYFYASGRSFVMHPPSIDLLS